jgi:hypothetical protein
VGGRFGEVIVKTDVSVEFVTLGHHVVTIGQILCWARQLSVGPADAVRRVGIGGHVIDLEDLPFRFDFNIGLAVAPVPPFRLFGSGVIRSDTLTSVFVWEVVVMTLTQEASLNSYAGGATGTGAGMTAAAWAGTAPAGAL